MRWARPGATTTWLIGKAGEPHDRYTNEDGSKTWIYNHGGIMGGACTGVEIDWGGQVVSTWISD